MGVTADIQQPKNNLNILVICLIINVALIMFGNFYKFNKHGEFLRPETNLFLGFAVISCLYMIKNK